MYKVILLVSIILGVMAAAKRKHFVATKLFNHKAVEEWKDICGGIWGDWLNQVTAEPAYYACGAQFRIEGS